MINLNVFDFMLRSSGRLFFAALLTFGSPAVSQSEQVPMSEFDLRSLMPFGTDDILNYAACEVNSYPNCTYIWGVFDSDDEARVKLGGKPDGDKLLTVFAQAHSSQIFIGCLRSLQMRSRSRVLASKRFGRKGGTNSR